MAAKKNHDSDPPKVSTTKIPGDLVRKAKVVATLRGVRVSDYIEGLLRPAIERDYQKAINEEAS